MKIIELAREIRNYWSESTREPQLPRSRQIVEMFALFVRRNIGPRYYLQARWGRQSIRFAEKLRHVNRAEYLALIRTMNPEAYQKASQHKLVEKSVLTLMALPTPRFIAYIHRTRGRDRDGRPVTTGGQLEEVLKLYVKKRVCFKLVEGWGGHGFASYDVVEGKSNHLQLVGRRPGSELSVSQWWDGMPEDSDGFIVEEYLHQHADLAALNPSSVNTIRIWVAHDGREWHVLGAYLRIGQKGSEVDNATSGGITCRVDPQSGVVLEAYDPANPGRSLDVHPDSGTVLVGMKIPFWADSRNLAVQGVSSFPHMRLAGLDIAIGPEGPTLIELNLIPDYIGCARMDLPLRPWLEIARA